MTISVITTFRAESSTSVLEDSDRLLDLFGTVVDRDASDLHLRAAIPPVMRIDGALVPLDLPPLSGDEVEGVLNSLCSPEQKSIFDRDKDIDFAIEVPGLMRFRVNALRQQGTVSLAFRAIPFQVPSIDSLGLPQVCKTLALRRRGLILVTGPTGSGKSTTLAAMIEHMNLNCGRNVVTIEDPIEYVHHSKKCIIAQRNLGDDATSFCSAVVHALRHDADVIAIGEIRDLDTMNAAITAAETGHLVLGTLHTIDAVRSVDRIVDLYPADQRAEVRLRLSQVIEAILSQTLLPRIDGGRVPAFEIMVANGAIRDLIREERTAELPRNMELSSKEEGMHTLDQGLADLVARGIVTKEEALARSSNPTRLQTLLFNLQPLSQGAPDTVSPCRESAPVEKLPRYARWK